MPAQTKARKSAVRAAPSPEHLFSTLSAYQRSEALKAAIELDVFTAIDEGNATAGALAGRCKAAERGMRILCDYLVVIGFLTKRAGRYGLTPDSAVFLSRKSPACMASVAGFLGSPLMTESYKNLAAAVRKGGTVLDKAGTLAPEHPVWVEFARSMAPMMAMPAEGIARLLKAPSAPAWKVLDVAAGHGVFGIALAKHNPRAEVTALDWPNVLQVAGENARAAGVAARYKTLPGSALDVELGSGYDLVLLTNILHHFDAQTNVGLLRKVRASLAPRGRAVVLEFVPNEDRVSPPMPAGFSLVMLGSTPAGDAYTYAEYESMLRAAGFARSELHPLAPSPHSVILAFA